MATPVFFLAASEIISRTNIVTMRGFALKDVNEGHRGTETGNEMVGSWGLEPQTSTVSR